MIGKNEEKDLAEDLLGLLMATVLRLHLKSLYGKVPCLLFMAMRGCSSKILQVP